MERNTQPSCRYVQETGYCPKLKTGACRYRHPPHCKNNTECWNPSCTFIHDTEQCRFGAKCYSKDCSYRHPRDHQQTRPNPAPPQQSNPNSNREDIRNKRRYNGEKETGKEFSNNSLRDFDTRSEMSRSSRQERDTDNDSSDRSTKKARSPLEELLDDRRKFNVVVSNVRAIGHVKRALFEFDAIIKSTGKAVYRLTKQLEADRDQVGSILHQQAQEATLFYKELLQQRRTVVYTIFSAIKGLTGPSISTNYLILRELNRLKEHLPILAKRFEITEALKKNSFIVVQGGSGCGKSTQLAQYFADMPEFTVKKVIIKYENVPVLKLGR